MKALQQGLAMATEEEVQICFACHTHQCTPRTGVGHKIEQDLAQWNSIQMPHLVLLEGMTMPAVLYARPPALQQL